MNSKTFEFSIHQHLRSNLMRHLPRPGTVTTKQDICRIRNMHIPREPKILPATYLVSDEHFDDVLVGGVGFQLVEPVLDLGERLPACDVVDDDDTLVSML